MPAGSLLVLLQAGVPQPLADPAAQARPRSLHRLALLAPIPSPQPRAPPLFRSPACARRVHTRGDRALTVKLRRMSGCRFFPKMP